jgi:cytoskeletal protein RodZ
VVTPEQPWLAWIIAAVVLLALLSGGWFGTRRLLAWRAANRAAQTSTQSAESSPASTDTPQQTTTEPSPQENAAQPPDGQESTSGASGVAPDSGSSTPAISSANDLFELKIEANKKTKVVVVADNDVVFDGTMKVGENHFFSAADHFQVSAKDAGVLHLELNGKTLAPIGPPGKSGKVTLTRDALKGPLGGGN